MVVSSILFAIAAVCLVCGVVSSVLIAESLRRRGVNVSFLFLRVMIFKYLSQYRSITFAETGRTGPLFYSYVIAMNVALAATIAGLLVRAY